MVSMLPNNDAMILNGVYWLFATKFVFLSILMFKTFITRVTFITPLHTLTYLRVNSDITTEEIAKTISRLLNNIVLKLDGILNKALKTCRLLIVF
jgi:hypothetical protein